jgi:hypothetical protein
VSRPTLKLPPTVAGVAPQFGATVATVREVVVRGVPGRGATPTTTRTWRCGGAAMRNQSATVGAVATGATEVDSKPARTLRAMTSDPSTVAPSSVAGVELDAGSLVIGANPSPGDPVPSSSNAASVALGATRHASSVTWSDAPGQAVSVVVRAHFRPLGNRREHWRVRARRVERERLVVGVALATFAPPALPITVELHRVGWCAADPDGLVGCMKVPIDAIAQWLGVDDRDRRAHWRLSQSVDRTIPRVARLVRGKTTYVRSAELRITVRPWTPEDGEAALVVAPAPNPKRIRQPRPKGNAP